MTMGEVDAHEMVDICVKYLQNMVRGPWIWNTSRLRTSDL